jgi:hypothetical protein
MLMSHLSPDRSDRDMSTKSCMLLHAMGQHMPIANYSLLSLRAIAEFREANLSTAATAYLMAGYLKTNNAIVLNKVNIVSDASSGQAGGGLVLQEGSLSFTDTIRKIRTESTVASVPKPAVDDDALPASENTDKTSR